MFDAFPRYTEFDPEVPVWCLTPHEGRTIHRFFDTSPFSPSGRLLAAFRLPQEDRLPRPGERGQVVVVDLAGGTERVVAETAGWEPQMGANVQWGADDSELLFNDVDTDTWRPHCVVLDPATGKRRSVGCGIYKASPDGRRVACANLAAMRRTQNGYGVVVPDERTPRHVGLADDDGLYVTDLASGRSQLLVSIGQCVRQARPRSELADLDGYEVYGFHCKWNPQGTRLIFTLRGYPADWPDRFDTIGPEMKFNVLTLDNDAKTIHLAVPAREWHKGGHHINWFPDGERLSMNLNIDGEGMRLVQCHADGTDLRKILPDTPGSGHPTVHPDGRHIVTDAYCFEPLAFGDGTTPIRLVDRATGQWRTIIRIRTQTPAQATHSCLRVDPHPAWDPTHRYLAFNAFTDGTRRVYVADLAGVVDPPGR